MKVRTDLRAGITVAEIWQDIQSALTNAGHAVGAAAQDIAHKAQAVVNDPGVRETTGKLMWWPFGPPRL
jgi:hypothetical protein